MRHLVWAFLLLIGSVVVIMYVSSVSIVAEPAKNPDPNHAHADFAVWDGWEKIDFSAPEYMMTEEKEAKLKPVDPRLYIHLHDGNGHVIHRHKTGLGFGDFLHSIGFELDCVFHKTSSPPYDCTWLPNPRMFVNGVEIPFVRNYMFKDDDQILVYYSAYGVAESWRDTPRIQRALSGMASDACLYSRTCPERGKPPTENCIADPTVPCTEGGAR
ncbi:hypothetical protein HY213_03420 [Candidatus Peregrinibacteria bacterium]|nr:hypothetical protein [Candidatus Peregrinibacteria bacterium]